MSDITVEEQPAREVKTRTPRKRTTKVATGETSEASVTSESSVSEATAVPEEKPKRRRGRPRKAEDASPSETSQDSSSDSGVEAEAPAVKSDRKKAASKNSASRDSEDASNTSNTGEAQVRSEEGPNTESSTSDASSDSSVSGESNTEEVDSSAKADGSSSDKSKRKQRNNNQKNQSKNSHQNGYQKNSQQQKGNNGHYRNRRQHQQNRREPVVPQTSRDELAKLKVAELRTKAEELGVESKGLKKAELVDAVFDASVKAEGFIEVEGILDILSDGYGFLRIGGYLPSENDVYVGLATIRRNGLRKGDMVAGQVRPARPNEKYAALQRVDTINGKPADELGKRVRFSDLTPVFPDERLVLEHGKSTITARVIDLCAPIGKGQRGLIVSPPKAGKTTILKDIAASITANNPEVHLMCLLVDERPEEVTDMERSIRGEVVSSTFDMPSENHIAVAEMVIERAKRLVEDGGDVVILLDSLTRLARAYNLATPASGRILSGGVDSTALYPPKKFLGAARNIEGGGSLTILASALIETGSKMDEVIFEEFKGTGNMEVKLDRALADRRIFPAIDPVASGTRREDLLLDPQEAPLIWAVRRVLANRNNVERATESLVKSLQQTNNNQEFLLRAAKKAQGKHFEEGNFEL